MLAQALIERGGSRRCAAGPIDHRVGFADRVTAGQAIAPGDRLATVHAADERSAEVAVQHPKQCIRIGAPAPVPSPVPVARVAEPSTRTLP